MNNAFDTIMISIDKLAWFPNIIEAVILIDLIAAANTVIHLWCRAER